MTWACACVHYGFPLLFELLNTPLLHARFLPYSWNTVLLRTQFPPTNSKGDSFVSARGTVDITTQIAWGLPDNCTARTLPTYFGKWKPLARLGTLLDECAADRYRNLANPRRLAARHRRLPCFRLSCGRKVLDTGKSRIRELILGWVSEVV